MSGYERGVPVRASVSEVLQMEDVGASSYGSTYRKSLIQCPFEHGLLYEVGLRPESPAEALTVGIIFHYALQRYYEELMRYQREFERDWRKAHPANPEGYRTQDAYYWAHETEAANIAWNAIQPLQHADGYAETWETVSRCVSGYFDRYARLDRWRIIAVEETVEYLGVEAGTFNHTARLDLFVEDTVLGRVFLIEHKTAKYLNSTLLDFYDLDFQILGQCWLAAKCLDWQAIGIPFGGVLINITTKHKSVTQFSRHAVLPRPDHLRAFETMVGQAENMREFHKSVGWPKSFGQCAGAPRGYAKCQFYELCREHPLETTESIKAWRDAPKGFAFKGVDAPTFENREV